MSDNQSKTVGQQILERIKALEGMLRLLSLEKKLEELESRINSLTSGEIPSEKPAPSVDLKDSLANLEEFTTVKRDKNGKRTFLLHRPTPNFEYGKAADDNHYETAKETDWIGEIEAAESQQKAKNPVVSCWVSEEAISKVTGAEENTGTWGQLGSNPNATLYKIWVKPGRYQIYKELRE